MKTQKVKSTDSGTSRNPRAQKSTADSKTKKAASPGVTGKRIPKTRPPRKVSALERIGVDLDDLEAAPRITDILASAFSTGKRIPRVQTVNFLAASPAPEARAFLEVYRELPIRDRESLPLEAICIKASVNPLAILGAVLMAAKNLKAQESALKAIMAGPALIDATIDSATQGTPILVDGVPVLDKRGRPILAGHGNDKAQKMMLEGIGFLPTKQGSNIAINLGMGQQAESDGEDDDDKAFDEAFGTPGEIGPQIEKWSENRRLLLEGK
jgi:hypothetical protein